MIIKRLRTFSRRTETNTSISCVRSSEPTIGFVLNSCQPERFTTPFLDAPIELPIQVRCSSPNNVRRVLIVPSCPCTVPQSRSIRARWAERFPLPVDETQPFTSSQIADGSGVLCPVPADVSPHTLGKMIPTKRTKIVPIVISQSFFQSVYVRSVTRQPKPVAATGRKLAKTTGYR